MDRPRRLAASALVRSPRVPATCRGRLPNIPIAEEAREYGPIHGLRPNRTAATLRPMIEDLLEPGGAPRHDDVDEQDQDIGNRLHLVEVFGLMTSDATCVDRTLEGVDRLDP
jgi:hypothetical protein